MLISFAHAADRLDTPAHHMTLTAAVLFVLGLAAMLAFAFWSWRRREALLARRRAAEQALRASRARLDQLSAQLPVALFDYLPGPPAAFRSLSDGVERLLPGTAAGMRADPGAFFAGIHPDDLPGLRWRNPEAQAADFEWVGRSLLPGDGQRWLQIRTTTTATPEGRRMILGVALDVTALKRAQIELRELATHREARVEQERARLAREVHDELGQTLTAARMRLQLLRNELGEAAEAAEDRIAEIDALIGESYRSVKSIAADLRPGALNLGLTAAVEWLAERLLAPADIVWTIDFAPEADHLDEGRAIALFRIVQESLGNIVRHAGARRVELRFAAAGGMQRLEIADNGRGFDPEGVDRRAHFGLLGMSERAQALGAALRVDSRPGAGTTLTCIMPGGGPGMTHAGASEDPPPFAPLAGGS